MGFPALFGKFPELGRKTHFRQIKFALNGVGKPISGQSIPIRGQTQGFSCYTRVEGDDRSVGSDEAEGEIRSSATNGSYIAPTYHIRGGKK